MSENSKLDLDFLGITEDQIKTVDVSEADVVSRQLMSRVKEITATIRPDGIIFNTTCIRSMIDVAYIQMLVDREKHLLYVRPSEEYNKDTFRWCNIKNQKRTSRKITGREFGKRIYNIMKTQGWSKGYSYRVGGTPAKQVNADDEYMLVFELDEYDENLMTTKGLLSAGVDDEDLGEKAEQIRMEISIMEKEQAEAKAAAADGKKRRVRKRIRHQKVLEDGAFGVKSKEHVNRIEVPVIEQLEMINLFGGVERSD
ncbi:MAG: hypothetical protein IKF90_22095 [Parasporobacterium sp.]|nr:hypothetical protein [Parasporobacterium sp.]